MSKRCKFQLYEQGAMVGGGKAIESSGGVVYVAQNGSPSKRTITDVDGTALTNPRALTNGSCEFYVADSVEKVDLYIACPDGQFLVVQDAEVEQIDDLYVDKGVKHQCMVIPFDQADFSAATEKDSGFDEPKSGKALMLPHPAIRVTTVDATETMEVGTDSADSGDADGFLDAIDLATAALVQGLILNGANTMGALFERQDSANAGDLVPAAHVSAGKSITYTTTAGSDTGKGFIYLPYLLCD